MQENTTYITHEESLEYEIRILKNKIIEIEKINRKEQKWGFFGRSSLYFFVLWMALHRPPLLLFLTICLGTYLLNKYSMDKHIADYILKILSINKPWIKVSLYIFLYIIKWIFVIYLFYRVGIYIHHNGLSAGSIDMYRGYEE